MAVDGISRIRHVTPATSPALLSGVTGLTLCNHSEIAGKYDQQNAAAIVQLERLIQAKLDFIGVKQDSRFLDYACGTGMLSRVSHLGTSKFDEKCRLLMFGSVGAGQDCVGKHWD